MRRTNTFNLNPNKEEEAILSIWAWVQSKLDTCGLVVYDETNSEMPRGLREI